jgi:hypothetical protein
MNMIDEFPEVDKYSAIEDVIKDIERAKFYIADCTKVKNELEAHLAALLEHKEDGQKTYYEAGFEICIKASVNYSLDKEEYEIIKNRIPPEFDPIRKSKKEVITYNLDKKVIKNIMTYGDDELKKLVFDAHDGKRPLIEEKPRSLSISIGVK